jgi:excisionase family DNA binding protein
MAEWMDVGEAADRSGFCRRTIYRAIHAGELAALKRRSRWRIGSHDFERWMSQDDRLTRDGSDDEVGPCVVPLAGSLASLRAIEAEAA